MSNEKISTFLRDCLLKCRTVPSPGDEMYWKTFEKDRGHVSTVKNIADAIEGAAQGLERADGIEYSSQDSRRIDEPFRDITINTWYKLFHVGNYYAGLFVPECGDEQFKKDLMMIWDILIRNTIMGNVFLGYGEDLVQKDRELIVAKGDLDNLPNAQLHCPFRLYTRVGYGKYYSVLAGHELEDESLEDRLVKFWIRDANYWLEWWHILFETLGGFERVKALAKFAGVRTIVSVDEGEEELNKELYDAMEGLFPVLRKKGGVASISPGSGVLVDNEYQPHEFVPVDAPRQLLEFYITYFDLMTDNLGYAGKGSPHKMERLTQQESMQGSNVVSTIQWYLCQRINSCFDVCRKVWGEGIVPEDFEVTVTSRVAAEAILDPEQEQAQQEVGFNQNEQQHN